MSLALSLSPVSESVAASPLCVRLLPLVRASVAASYLPLQLTNSVTCHSSLQIQCYQIQCYLPLQLTNTVLPATPAYKYSVTKYSVTYHSSLQIQYYLPLQLTNTVLPNTVLPTTPAYKYSVTCHSSLQIQCYLPLQLTNTVLPTTPAYKNRNRFKGNAGGNSERRGRAHMGFSERIYVIPNCTELN